MAKLCEVLKVSRSGFYAYIRGPKSKRQEENERLVKKIKEIHEQNHRIYGYRRITEALPEGMKAGKNRVYRLMKENGIASKTRRKYRPKTTDSNHNLPVAENILNREFTAERPCQKWVSDITYIDTDEGFLYLAGIIDLHGGQVVGWAMGENMKKGLVIDALKQAIGRFRPGAGLLLHSDRGSQYCSNEYQAIIKKNGFICSMSRKGNCWDNAPMESFWGKLKSEWLRDKRFRTREEAKTAIFEYIEIYYNRKRLHSTNGYKTPVSRDEVA